MTRKDYILIAAALRDALGTVIDPYTHRTIAEGVHRATTRLADALGRDNPRFDRERFLKAAGVQS